MFKFVQAHSQILYIASAGNDKLQNFVYLSTTY